MDASDDEELRQAIAESLALPRHQQDVGAGSAAPEPASALSWQQQQQEFLERQRRAWQQQRGPEAPAAAAAAPPAVPLLDRHVAVAGGREESSALSDVERRRKQEADDHALALSLAQQFADEDAEEPPSPDPMEHDDPFGVPGQASSLGDGRDDPAAAAGQGGPQDAAAAADSDMLRMLSALSALMSQQHEWPEGAAPSAPAAATGATSAAATANPLGAATTRTSGPVAASVGTSSSSMSTAVGHTSSTTTTHDGAYVTSGVAAGDAASPGDGQSPMRLGMLARVAAAMADSYLESRRHQQEQQQQQQQQQSQSPTAAVASSSSGRAATSSARAGAAAGGADHLASDLAGNAHLLNLLGVRPQQGAGGNSMITTSITTGSSPGMTTTTTAGSTEDGGRLGMFSSMAGSRPMDRLMAQLLLAGARSAYHAYQGGYEDSPRSGGAGAAHHAAAGGGGLGAPGDPLGAFSGLLSGMFGGSWDYERMAQLQDVAVTTPEDVLQQLPRSQYVAGRRPGDSTTCAVCQCDYEPGDTLLHLPCLHAFHEECVLPWLQNHSNKCPICKTGIGEHGEPVMPEQ